MTAHDPRRPRARRTHRSAGVLVAGFTFLASACPVALPPTAAAGAPLEATRELSAGLRRSGRAEVTLAWQLPGSGGRGSSAQRGALALEPPDLARLDVTSRGEIVTLRADGGEWLQPALRQFVLLKPRHSVAALRWWRTLAGAGGATERRLAARHYRLSLPASNLASADSADVWLDARGLPERLALHDGLGSGSVYRLTGWRFVAARGPSAFRLVAPPGVETVELP